QSCSSVGKTNSVCVEGCAAGRAKVGLANSVTNAKAAISGFIISLHAYGPPLVIFLRQKKTDASCLVFPRKQAQRIARRNRLSARLGPVISLDLLDKPTIEGLILWFRQLAPSPPL